MEQLLIWMGNVTLCIAIYVNEIRLRSSNKRRIDDAIIFFPCSHTILSKSSDKLQLCMLKKARILMQEFDVHVEMERQAFFPTSEKVTIAYMPFLLSKLCHKD